MNSRINETREELIPGIRIVRVPKIAIVETPVFDFELEGAEEERSRLEKRDAVLERSATRLARVALQRKAMDERRIANGLSRAEDELRGQQRFEEQTGLQIFG